MTFKGFSHRPSDRRRFQGVTLHIPPREEFANNIMAGTFGSETEAFHLLNQFALRIPGRRKRLFLFQIFLFDRQLFTGCQFGKNRIFRATVGVDVPVALLIQT